MFAAYVTFMDARPGYDFRDVVLVDAAAGEDDRPSLGGFDEFF